MLKVSDPLSWWSWLVSCFTDVDARVKSDLENHKEAFEREIEQIGQEGRQIDNDIRSLEEEAATLHKQRVRTCTWFW